MDKSLYEQFFQIESEHWWFRARREIILDQIRRNITSEKDNAILDIGCGTGIMLKRLMDFGHAQGIDFSEDAVHYSNLRLGCDGLVHLDNLMGNPENLPFEKENYDLITLLDVIEHMDNDTDALKKAWRLLKEGGILICTVPAYQFLWSGHDVLNHHKRRYTLKELKEKISASGFSIKKVSYFNTLLSPIVFLARLLVPPKKRMEPKSDFKIYPYLVNAALKNIFLLEKYLLRIMSFPFGVSLICIARKEGGLK